MGFSQRLSVEQTLEQRLTSRLALRTALINVVQGDTYEPNAVCPECLYTLKPLEILKGFSADPNDFNTTCPACEHRFPAQLKSSRPGSSVTVALYCDTQTLHQLAPMKTLTPEEFRAKNASLYHSAIFHNGCLKTAFARIGEDYPHEVITDPREKIIPFLGRLSDGVIAKLTGTSSSSIRRFRRGKGIAAYTGEMED